MTGEDGNAVAGSAVPNPNRLVVGTRYLEEYELSTVNMDYLNSQSMASHDGIEQFECNPDVHEG